MGTLLWFFGVFTLLALPSSGHLLGKDTVTPLIDYTVRLVDGPDISQGRLEMLIQGTWGTICDDGFDDLDAQVACFSLGFNENQGTFQGNTYGPGTGPVYFSQFQCVGTEGVLDDCPHGALGEVGNCTNANDVSIACVGTGYPMRLVGGSVITEGRLELQYRGVWGTICDDSFGVEEAQVACHSLGMGRQGLPVQNSFGEGTGPILLDDLGCLGTEDNIGYCEHPPWGTHNCQHSEDAAVTCASTVSTGPDVATRLAGGPSPNEGRIEMYFGGSWGTVCDSGFRDVEAQVACSNLGFDAGQGTFLGNQYGPGTDGGVYMDNVVCTGSEEVLVDCEHLIFGSSNCTHSQDVSIACVGATSYDVRLVGSANAYEGRVEIFYRGQWGTVCDDSFDTRAAQVVCNTLGYGYTGRFLANEFGPGTGTIWLDDVVCQGSESNIGHCPHSPWGTHNCQHSEDASITCAPPDFAVRLIGGATANEGRIEAFLAGEWGTVCDTGFGPTEAAVACTSLGFDQGQGTFLGNEFGPGTGNIFLDQVDCTGDELTLNECDHAEIGQNTCSHTNDVSISCVGTGYPVRLVGGVFPTDGRLEIFYRGVWGTVCDDLFTNVEAQVACFGLGYPRGIGRFTGNSVGTGQIWLDDLRCGGYETNIGNCAHAFWGENNCLHTEDVAISCSTSTGTMYPVRLIGSDGALAQNSGRLEYYNQGTWGTVCDPNFTDQDAQVACYSLGFNQFEGTYIGQAHGSGTGSLLLDNVACTGTEVMIDDCPHSVWGSTNCDHTTDASISCVGPWPAMPVRLVNPGSNSSNPTEGRLEIQYYGTWGTVCDDAFTVSDARVACASLGFGYIGSMITNSFGPAIGQIWLDQVNCIGDELNIGLCNHNNWGEHDCAHSEDTAISCV